MRAFIRKYANLSALGRMECTFHRLHPTWPITDPQLTYRFQWVKCQLDALCTLITDKSIRTALKQLPNGLDETYVRAFTKIRKDIGDDATMIKRVFWWLIHSLRPLTLHELSEAIAIEIGQTHMDFSAVPTDPEDLINLCGGLITISGHEQETVHLSHFSVKEFLLSPRIKETQVAEFFAGPSTVRDIAATSLKGPISNSDTKNTHSSTTLHTLGLNTTSLFPMTQLE